MQIRKLHRLLGEMIDSGQGYKKVMIRKNTFKHPLEKSDGVTILPVKRLNIQTYPIMDGDGFTLLDSKEQEVYHTSLVLKGDI